MGGGKGPSPPDAWLKQGFSFLVSRAAFPLVSPLQVWVQLVDLCLCFQCIWAQPCGTEAWLVGRGKLRKNNKFAH